MSGVIVNYNNNQLTSMSSSGTKTLLTSGKYCENDFEVVYDAPTTSSLTVTPTETSQTFNATGVYGYKPVTVNAISSTYIGTGVTTRSAADLSIWQSRITAPSGYYSSNASIYMPAYDLQVPTTSFSQTTGTFVASCSISTAGYYGVQYGSKSQSLNTIAAQTIYPSTTDQYVSSYRWLTGSQTIKSVTTTNLTAANIAEGVTVKVGDSSNASRITQVTGTHIGGGNDFIVTLSQNAYGSFIIDKTYNEVWSAHTANKNIAVTGDGSVYYTGAIWFDDYESTFDLQAYSLLDDGLSAVMHKDIYTFYSNFSYPNGSSDFYEPHNMNATPSDVASGKRFINASGFQVGTYTATPTYTATLTGNGSSVRAYVTYNGTKYYSSGNTFTYTAGDSLSIFVSNYNTNSSYRTTELIINGETIVKNTDGTVINSTYLLPSCNININTYYGNSPYDYVAIAEQIIPSSTAVLSSYGVCNVYGYSTATTSTGELAIYKALATRTPIHASGYNSSAISYTSIDIQNWCDSLSILSAQQFAGQLFSGHFTFNNLNASAFDRSAFASARIQTYTGYAYWWTFSFPIMSLIPEGMFANQANLLGVDCLSCKTISEYAFCGCMSLASINFPSCTSIGNYAFSNCDSLTSINFPNCTSIGYSAFYGCNNLESIYFSSCIKAADNCFRSCSKLTTISMPLCETIGIYAFCGCMSLASINFPSCTTIGDGAFSSCSSLTSINFPNCTSIGNYAFYGCNNLKSINFSLCGYVSNNAFQNCYNLSTVNLPVCTSIEGYVFRSCSSLVNVNLSACKSISHYAFANCSALTNINLPVCTSIGSYVFGSCVSLTTISLPVCTSFGNYTFTSCFNLISLYLNNVSSVPTFGTGMFQSTPIVGYSTSAGRYGSIFVPSSLYSSFLNAGGWAAYSSRIVSV